MTDTKIALSLHSPADLVEAIPYLLGFTPTVSTVVVGMGADGDGPRKVRITARVDHPGMDQIDDVAQALANAGATEAMVVYYLHGNFEMANRSDLPDLTDEIAEVLSARAVDVAYAVLVSEGRWWAVGDSGPGTRLIGGLVQAIEAGMAPPVGSRSDLLTVLDPSPDEAPEWFLESYQAQFDSVHAHSGEVPGWQAIRTAGIWAHLSALVADPGLRLSGRQLARISLAWCDITVRDEFWLALEAGHDLSAEIAALALEVGTRCRGRYAAAGLFLYAWARWRAGDGVLALGALDRIEGDYSAGALLTAALQLGADPKSVPRLRRQDLAE